MFNFVIVFEKGYNVEVLYFNFEIGVKIFKFIENVEILIYRSIKKEDNLK